MGGEPVRTRDLSLSERDRAVARRAFDAAAMCGTPAYVYDLEALDANVARLQRALSGVDLQLRYFEFANRNPAILKRICALGQGVTAARPTGVERALRAGFDAERIELLGLRPLRP